MSGSLVRGLFFALVAEALLVWNTGAALQEKGALLDMQPRRFWEDLSLATGHFRTGELPVAYNAAQRWKDEKGETYYRERGGILTTGLSKTSATPWRFWVTVPPRTIQRLTFELFPRFDDVGRPLLLGKVFRRIGGVAPYLFFWMGAILLFPILVWLAVELDESGRPLVSALGCIGLGASAFLADSLALSYSSAGYYVLGTVLLATFAVATCLRSPGIASLWVKALVAGVFLALLVICRGGALLLLPGFCVAALRGSWRAGGMRKWMVWVVACVLLIAPTVWAREEVDALTRETFAGRGRGTAPPQYHAVWFGIWAGLGDFDATKGHVWDDAATSAFMVQRGGSPLNPGSYDPRNEEILRSAVLADVLSDPSWYLTILTKRLGATIVQWNILPWGPSAGFSSRFDESSRGYVASYYTLTAHVDVFRLYPLEVEVPFWALIALTASLLILRRKDEMLWWLSFAAGALALPVLITTAGAIEPMGFGLVYVLGAALGTEAWARRFLATRAKGNDVAA